MALLPCSFALEYSKQSQNHFILNTHIHFCKFTKPGCILFRSTAEIYILSEWLLCRSCWCLPLPWCRMVLEFWTPSYLLSYPALVAQLVEYSRLFLCTVAFSAFIGMLEADLGISWRQCQVADVNEYTLLAKSAVVWALRPKGPEKANLWSEKNRHKVSHHLPLTALRVY